MRAAGALLTCCVGHSLLIAAGFAGLSAPLGAFTGDTALLGAALLAGLVIAAFSLLRLRRQRLNQRQDGCPPAGSQLGRPGVEPSQ